LAGEVPGMKSTFAGTFVDGSNLQSLRAKTDENTVEKP
jgi:hypothetical protein